MNSLAGKSAFTEAVRRSIQCHTAVVRENRKIAISSPTDYNPFILSK